MNVKLDTAKLARIGAKHLMSVPLQDKSSAKILWNDYGVDCFIMKNGKLLETKGEKCTRETMPECLGQILDEIEKRMEPGFDLMKEMTRAFKRKNVI